MSLLDIVDAIDGETAVFRTSSNVRVTGATPEKRQTALRSALDRAEEALRHELAEVTIDAIGD